jgi:hypothetical protein
MIHHINMHVKIGSVNFQNETPRYMQNNLIIYNIVRNLGLDIRLSHNHLPFPLRMRAKLGQIMCG